MTCKHEDVVFLGTYSLIGDYVCQDCGERFDPVEYAKTKGDLNVNLIDYYMENPDKLNPMWHDHPMVAHLFEGDGNHASIKV